MVEAKSKIPALALLGLSFTQCTAREQAADPIVGDWRAIQVDGEKHPQTLPLGQGVTMLMGEQLRIDDDLAGEMARYQSAEYDGYNYETEFVADLVVDGSAAPKYRIDVHHDLFEYYDDYRPDEPPGYDDSGYATGPLDTGADESGDYAGQDDDGLAAPRPLAVPTRPQRGPGALVFDCTLDNDTLNCELEGATDLKQWVFARVRPEEG